MSEFIAGTYPYRNRHAIMDAVADAAYRHPSPTVDGGEVVVIVRVTAPQMDEPTPEQARGCATKVTNGGSDGNQ